MARFPNAQNNPAGAIPVYVTSGGSTRVITDRSGTFATGDHTVAAANPNRTYLLIQCVTAGVAIQFNPLGKSADPAANQTGNILLGVGQSYESGPVALPGEIHIYVPSNNTQVTVLEG